MKNNKQNKQGKRILIGMFSTEGKTPEEIKKEIKESGLYEVAEELKKKHREKQEKENKK